jgi:hypothetical protein
MVAELTTNSVEGVVLKVNERGVLLEDSGAWRNVSKFAGELLMPEPGEAVRLTLDKAGFIRQIAVLRAGEPLRFPAADRETCITRMACLNTATAITSSGGQATDLASVLAVAEELEAWVLR